MPYRSSLKSAVDLLADMGVFEGRTVTFQIVNGRDIRVAYDPPLEPVLEAVLSGPRPTAAPQKVQ